MVDRQWGRRRHRFSRREVTHLGASILALTLAFLFIRAIDPGELFLDPSRLALGEVLAPTNLAVALLVVVTGFLFHELAHKFAAQIYGHWSEFRASFPHLVLAVVISLFGVLFAAPGAVNIVGNVTERENGVISAVGPLSNLVMATLFILLRQAYLRTPLGDVFFWAGAFNVALAGFNLIPFRPLDGSKVVRWNVGIYLLLVVIVVFQLNLLFPELLFIP